MDYSDYHLSAKELSFQASKEKFNPSDIDKNGYYRIMREIKRRETLERFSNNHRDFSDLINEHFDLEFGEHYNNPYLGKSPKIALTYYMKHIDTFSIILRWDHTELRAEGAKILLDTCLLGLVSYCEIINKIDSNTALKQFIFSTDYKYNFALCKKLCPLLNVIAINSTLKQKIEQSIEKIVNAIGKVDLYLASENSSYFKKIYESTYPSMKKEGCYIATMVYGSYSTPEVIQLRRFRDNVLKKSMIGNLFIKIYYSVSPIMVKYLRRFRSFHIISKKIIETIFKLG